MLRLRPWLCVVLGGCQRLRGFCMARLPLLCASLASLHLLLNGLEGFLGLANGQQVAEFLDLHRRMRRLYLTEGLTPFRQLCLQRGLLLLCLLVEQA